jgi:hypothetical protein
MNYLTNYYKNLSEQLQEELNNLQSILREAAPPSTSGYDPLRPDGHSDPFLDASDMTPENIAAVAKRYGNTPKKEYYDNSHDYNDYNEIEIQSASQKAQAARDNAVLHDRYMENKNRLKQEDEKRKQEEYNRKKGEALERISGKSKKLNQYENYINKIDEQINHLTSHLTDVILEYRKTKTQKVRIDDIENDGEEVPLIHGTVVTKKGNPAGKGAAKDRAVAFYPGMGSMPNYGKGIPSGTDEADAEEAIADWGRPTVENNPIYASLKGAGPAQDVRRGELFNPNRFGPDRGHNRPGTGQKAKKKAQAIRSAEYDRQRGRNAN